MLANDAAGEVVVEALGKTAVFALTLRALGQLANAFGTRANSEVFARIAGQNAEGPSFADVPAIVEALSGGVFTAAEVEALTPSQLAPINLGIMRAMVAAFPPEPEDAKKKRARSAEEDGPPQTVGRWHAIAVSYWGVSPRDAWAMSVREYLTTSEVWAEQFAGEGNPEPPSKEELDAMFNDPNIRHGLGLAN